MRISLSRWMSPQTAPFGSGSSETVSPAQASFAFTGTRMNCSSCSSRIRPLALSFWYCSTKPAEIIPVGIATTPTPRKAITIPRNWPPAVTG